MKAIVDLHPLLHVREVGSNLNVVPTQTVCYFGCTDLLNGEFYRNDFRKKRIDKKYRNIFRKQYKRKIWNIIFNRNHFSNNLNGT